jgi:cytochrome oxidase assembly protein ShyY1
MKKSPLFFIIVISLGIIFAIFLSYWQYQRYHYKNAKNYNLVKAFEMPEEFIARNLQKDRVYKVEGYFDFSKQILLGPRNLGQKIGKYIYSVFYVNGEYPILVNRGFIEKDNYEKIQNSGRSTWKKIEIFSQNEKSGSLFGIDNIVEKNIWIRIKMSQISEYLGLELGDIYYRKIALNNSSNNLIIEDFDSSYRYSNVHFQYIFFWLFIAITQFVMLIFFIRKNKIK